MVKISESAIKIVSYDKPKRLIGLSQKALEAGCPSLKYGIVDHELPGREQAPNLTDSCQRDSRTALKNPFGIEMKVWLQSADFS